MRPGSSLFRRQYFPSTLCLYICQIFVVWHHFIGAKTTMRFFYAKFHLLQIFSCCTFLGDWDFPLEKETKYKATRASQVPWAFFVELLFFSFAKRSLLNYWWSYYNKKKNYWWSLKLEVPDATIVQSSIIYLPTWYFGIIGKFKHGHLASMLNMCHGNAKSMYKVGSSIWNSYPTQASCALLYEPSVHILS